MPSDLSETVLDLMQEAYRKRLKADGIPLDPSQRTPDQQATAYLEQWAVSSEVTLTASGLAQGALEDN